ncbi:MAG TPA: hypothetical protein VNS22_18890 [Geminicoccus sp.]|uniref:hypothetical protein n=1 Tax=Geminicoccus sp. TaxID=2024832 RepID=UPI002BB41974|nr:hypothetical protein [Geminicoccus sp.]HWL70427.1 hypothetical protein [Geminicoccus sp.]
MAAVFARLQTLAEDFPTIERFGNWAVPDSALPALEMEDGEEEVVGRLSNRVDKVETMIRLTVTARAASDAEIGQTINAAIAKVQAVMGAEPTFGGVLQDCLYESSMGPFLPDDPGAPPTASVVLIYRLRRIQSGRDPRAVV